MSNLPESVKHEPRLESHFMAGFFDGYKGAFPGVAALDTIMHYHSAEDITHPKSTWGVTEGNPTLENVRAGGDSPGGDALPRNAENPNDNSVAPPGRCGAWLRRHRECRPRWEGQIRCG